MDYDRLQSLRTTVKFKEDRITEWNPWERVECLERVARVSSQVGQGVNIAVERFVAVGESIASDVPDLRDDMYHACNQARAAGNSIEKLCESATSEDLLNSERQSVLRAARSLLNSVTRVLLLADVVVVKQLLFSKDKTARFLGRLTGVTNFTEFVKAFSQFGAEMVELSHMTGDRTNCPKEQRRRAQIAAAKQVLDRSTMLLLTSSKACLRHPDSTGVRENRDTVFCQMRRAMDLIHYVIKDGLCDMPEDLDTAKTVSAAIQQFESLVEMTRLTFITQSTKESLSEAAESIFEQTQDFTDSAYTTHEHRENILVLCTQVKLQLTQLIEKETIPKNCELSSSPSDEIDLAVKNCLLSTMELKNQLIIAALEQTSELSQTIKLGNQIITALSNAALSCDEVRTQHYSLCFTQHIEQIVEMCKALRHIADSERHQISIRYTEINVRIYGPQIVAAAVTLIQHPSSKIAKDNIDVFIEMWHLITGDILTFYEEVTDSAKLVKTYTTDKSLKSALQSSLTPKDPNSKVVTINEGGVVGAAGTEEEDSSKWQAQSQAQTQDSAANNTNPEENSDIVKRAKSMSHMTFCMHQFTKGHGPLKTTQDLFTQAEYFAEEANRLYKVIRQFSYQVPVGTHKKELLEELDRIPTYVQQLQFTVKNPTVGKAATFSKVDSVINETKNMMNIITKVVSMCFVCANTYGLDLAGVSWEGGSGGAGGGEGAGRAGGDQSKGGSSSSSDPAI